MGKQKSKEDTKLSKVREQNIYLALENQELQTNIKLPICPIVLRLCKNCLSLISFDPIDFKRKKYIYGGHVDMPSLLSAKIHYIQKNNYFVYHNTHI